MVSFYLFLTTSLALSVAQNSQLNQNLPSVTIQDENLDDTITQIFNMCKCVIFYQCDEDNFIIPPDELNSTRATPDYQLRKIKRLRCSNDFYYCCKNRTTAPIVPTTIPTTVSTTVLPTYIPPRPTEQVFSTRSCGQTHLASRLIVQFPWMVAVLKKNQYNDEYHFKCGGALIHPKVVLTEQACVYSSTFDTLRIVSKKEILNENGSYSMVSKVIKHEDFSSGGLYNDIALIILEAPLTNRRTVCLPQPNENFDGKRCTAVGWGGMTKNQKRRLKKVDLPIVQSQECQHLLRNTSLGSDFQLSPSFLCAGGEEGKDTCQGDGGGALMCQENGRYVQVGIVSWGLQCGQKNVPSLYTNVASMVNWIEQKLINENL